MRRNHLRSAAGLVAGLTVGSILGLAPPANSSSWAPAASASIHPGVRLVTNGSQCTANFVFTAGGRVYLGYAAHCAALGEITDTDGCSTESLPYGTPVEIEGASQPGQLSYSSWSTMQANGETNAAACAYNDFALVEVAAADAGRVNPSIPHWGGPTGLNSTGNPALDRVFSYGNSSIRQGISLLSPKEGTSLGTGGDGWSHLIETITPGIPGDSGSAVLDAAGRATGVLSTVQLLPIPGANGVADLRLALDYLHSRTGWPVQLELGTEAFDPDRAALGL